MAPFDRFEPHPDVVCQDAGARSLLVHLETGETFTLNHTGQAVWELLSEGRELSSIADALASGAEAPTAHEIQADVDGLIAALLTHRLIRPAGH